MAAKSSQPKFTNPFKTTSGDVSRKDDPKDEWEDWEVDGDDSQSPSKPEGILIDLAGDAPEDRTRKPSIKSATRMTLHRPGQLLRVKSRARQKAQNAKAGIKLVTDMTQFRPRRGSAHQRSAGSTNKNKFADAVALRALEGQPSTPSIGSFAWLKRRPGNIQNKRLWPSPSESQPPDLSPESRPIVIGISVPSDDAASHVVSPQTAGIDTPTGIPFHSHKLAVNPPMPQQLRSVWSPDTEVSSGSPYSALSPDPSLYSHQVAFTVIPPVPVVRSIEQTMGTQDERDDDSGTPCTPFEEDGNNVAGCKSQQLKPSVVSPESASSRANGWWDHVTTPFVPNSNNPFKTQPQQTAPSSTSEWWNRSDEKKRPSSKVSHLAITTPANQGVQGSNASGTIRSGQVNESREQCSSEKAGDFFEDNRSNDAPPPYEPRKTQLDAKVAFSYPRINSQPVPSPGPLTPGLPGTMTSQGGINLADIPLTPAGFRPAPSSVLPDRAAGSYRTGDHFYEASGAANKVERQRRRHEKEDVVARKAGGFWRGRGCIPEDGCFGRSGREGRKRRRICLGILGGVIAAIILIIVLVVVLTHRAMSPVIGKAPATHTAAPDSTEAPKPSYWLNQTGFPPMPTGVLTVAGPSNSVNRPSCFTDETPYTAWSCAVPKGSQDPVSPYLPTQPIFIFQIQFDNDTRALWKLPDEAQPSGNERRSSYPTDKGFKPNPAPPSLEQMRFLGNTTDGIVSDRKEGEPTPFYISLLESVNKTVGPNMLMRRQGSSIGGSLGSGTGSFNLSNILPPPQLNPDGTGAPARLFPLSVQQPLRLFDRDLPTEHYGFYTYFDKTIYMKNSTHTDMTDKNGGVTIDKAHSLVTFAQTRFLVKIWTRKGDVRLIESADQSVNVTATPLIQPGSMPYPVTVIEDSHGGNPSDKVDFTYGIRSNMEVDRSRARQVVMNLEYEGTLVNGRGQDEDSSLGGIDGGTGGCKCEWINFEQ